VQVLSPAGEGGSFPEDDPFRESLSQHSADHRMLVYDLPHVDFKAFVLMEVADI
jgi:hypothetical protein